MPLPEIPAAYCGMFNVLPTNVAAPDVPVVVNVSAPWYCGIFKTPLTNVAAPLDPVVVKLAKDEDILIEPFPLLILMPEPAVKVALVNVFPLELPINNCPSVNVDCPVPPLLGCTTAPFQVALVIEPV